MIHLNPRPTECVVRSYSAGGIYWREPLLTPSAAYLPDDDVILTICQIEPDRCLTSHYSEFDDPSVEEYRLLAALTLTVDYDDGIVRMQPLASSLRFSAHLDLTDPDTLNGVVAKALEHLRVQPTGSADSAYPPYKRGSYEFRQYRAPLTLQQRVFSDIDLNDHLLTRGLRTLLRANSLMTHPLYSEDALYPLFVAMDASHSLFKRELEREGRTNVTAREVGLRFEEVFNETASDQPYFADYYTDRIVAQHPSSRFGEAPYLPTTRGEMFWLFKALRDVFRYFVLGEVVTCRPGWND